MLTSDGWRPKMKQKRNQHSLPGGEQSNGIATPRTHDIGSSVVLWRSADGTLGVVQIRRIAARLVRIEGHVANERVC